MELAQYRDLRLASKRRLNRAALARQNPVSVVGGGATIGGGGTGAGVSSPSSPPSGSFQRAYFYNYPGWYWPAYNNWYGYYPWWQGLDYGWPVGFGFGSPLYWPQWPQQWWPGPYAYYPATYAPRSYTVRAVS